MATTYTNIIRLKPGQCYILPSGSRITEISLQEGAAITSDCTLPSTISTLKCYYVEWSTAVGDSNTDPMEDYDVTYVGFYIGETFYPFSPTYAGGSVDYTLAAAIDAILPGAFTDIRSCTTSDIGDRRPRRLEFQTLPSIGDNFSFAIESAGFTRMRLRAVEKTDIPCNICDPSEGPSS